MRYRKENNHRQVLEKQKVTVWWGLWAGGVVRTTMANVLPSSGSVTDLCLIDFLWPELDDLDVAAKWFQQDGSTCHTTAKTIDLLRVRFGYRIISRRAPRNWPPRVT